jgi:hypothetical protein
MRLTKIFLYPPSSFFHPPREHPTESIALKEVSSMINRHLNRMTGQRTIGEFWTRPIDGLCKLLDRLFLKEVLISRKHIILVEA